MGVLGGVKEGLVLEDQRHPDQIRQYPRVIRELSKASVMIKAEAMPE